MIKAEIEHTEKVYKPNDQRDSAGMIDDIVKLLKEQGTAE